MPYFDNGPLKRATRESIVKRVAKGHNSSTTQIEITIIRQQLKRRKERSALRLNKKTVRKNSLTCGDQNGVVQTVLDEGKEIKGIHVKRRWNKNPDQ